MKKLLLILLWHEWASGSIFWNSVKTTGGKRKKNLAPVHLLSAQQAAYENWKEVAQRQICWAEPLSARFPFPPIYSFQLLFSTNWGAQQNTRRQIHPVNSAPGRPWKSRSRNPQTAAVGGDDAPGSRWGPFALSLVESWHQSDLHVCVLRPLMV